MGGIGIILKKKAYRGAEAVGWNGQQLDYTKRVDLVGHAWFFRQIWAKYLWFEEPYSWENGEDIMFSYQLQKYINVNTFVPPHPKNNKKVWSNLDARYGADKNASYKNNSNHYQLRDKICQYCIDNGWKTVNNVK